MSQDSTSEKLATSESVAVSKLKKPSIFRLIACFLYETLIVIAISFACGWAFILLFGDATHGLKRLALQLSLWAVIGAYFIRCWYKNGQTLAMQTWRLKLIQTENQQSLSLKTAVLRYVLACLSLAALGLGFLWALIDKDKLFFHDRLLKSSIIFDPQNTALSIQQSKIEQ